MLEIITSIPALVLIWVIVYDAFLPNEDEQKEQVRDLFNLDYPAVKLFYAIVVVSVLVWFIGFILPIPSTLTTVLTLAENGTAIVWFVQCLFAGKVSIWIELLKEKFKSKSK